MTSKTETIDQKLNATLPDHLRPYLTHDDGKRIVQRTSKNMYLAEFPALEKGIFKGNKALQDIAISALKLLYDENDIIARKDFRERAIISQSKEYIRNAERSLTRLQHEYTSTIKNHHEIDAWLQLAEKKMLAYDAEVDALKAYGICKKEGTPPSQEILDVLDEKAVSNPDFNSILEIKQVQFEKERFTMAYDRMVAEYIRLTKEAENKENEMRARKNQILTAEYSLTEKQKACSGVVSSGLLTTLVEQVGQCKQEETHAKVVEKSNEITKRFQEDMQDGLELLARPFKPISSTQDTGFSHRLDEVSTDIEKNTEQMRSIARSIRNRMYGE